MDTDPQRAADGEHTPETVPASDRETEQADTIVSEPVRDAEPGARPAEGDAVRPGGPSWPTVVLGVVAAAVGCLVLAAQLVNLDVNWSVATPVVVVAAGCVLVVLGILGLVTRRDQTRSPG